MSVEEILREVNALPPDEYARLMDTLAALLHKTDPEIDQAWGDEVERRLDEIKSNETELIDAEEVLKKFRPHRP